ncbi:hypothetical protein BD626DRAFT_579403 [Schizophyllum amplum]|uniref:Uncharacterized protein n=1 Tax=Schizophyllum amplum TaxID=97359 RepID=A0A550BRJ4_9AGAR|nr:hypothetical protein BD626DRAFT_579403 [Auriculariopsis ampla]
MRENGMSMRSPVRRSNDFAPVMCVSRAGRLTSPRPRSSPRDRLDHCARTSRLLRAIQGKLLQLVCECGKRGGYEVNTCARDRSERDGLLAQTSAPVHHVSHDCCTSPPSLKLVEGPTGRPRACLLASAVVPRALDGDIGAAVDLTLVAPPLITPRTPRLDGLIGKRP